MASRYNQLTMLYIFNILKLDASPKKPYSAPMVHRRLKELGINLDRKTVFNHMKILTEQMLSAEQEKESFFRQYLCSKLFRCRKEEGKKSRENGGEPGNESGYRICLPEEEIPENCVLYYYIEDEMSPEELEERFTRGDRSRHMEGNGLGLSIAKSLTELQKGDMEIVTDGDLFKVVITLPETK